MQKKEFLDPVVVRDNTIFLANQMIDSGYFPDIIYVLLRGGAYMGNIISEFYSLKAPNHKFRYAGIVTRSYIGLNQVSKVHIDGFTLNPEGLPKETQILIVDDIFDSGRSIEAVVQNFQEVGIPLDNIKVAVHDYKIRKYCTHQHKIHQPTFYCRKHIIESEDKEIWIHYLTHELLALTQEEKQKWYYEKNPSLYSCLDE